jgi:D-tyrosyl-tRNA(Tyr) deacylase
LTEADATRTVTIRTEPHSVMQAINRQVAHYSYHVGQIVFLAKHFASANWKTLTVPRGKSAAFTADVAAGRKSQR